MLYFKPKTRFFFMKKWTIFSPFWRETMLWVCNVIFLLPQWLDISSFCIGPNKDDYQLSLHWPQVKHHSNSSTSWYTPGVCNVIFLLPQWLDISSFCIGPNKDDYQLSLHWPQVKHHSNSSTSWYTPQQRLESNGLEKVNFWHFFLKNWNVKAFVTHEPK